MNETQVEEYRFLREELKGNRKLVFERPLIIAGATFAAAFTVSKHGLLGVIPLPFLIVLVFNLWFTLNRLQSSARIIAYLQLIHEGSVAKRWIGWETALRKHREWQFTHQKDSPGWEGRDDFRQYDHLAYYSGIYYFHLLLGLTLTTILVGHSTSFSAVIDGTASTADIIQLAANGFFTFLFGLVLLPFRPSKLRYGIETNRQIWIEVLDGE
jgi:hypothetical protein